MKMKKTVKMPLRRAPGGGRPPARRSRPPALRARAATAEETYDDEDYGGEEEPNMKFSHALFVVLVLHIIAVGGVFAFNSIKAQQTTPKTAAAETAKAEGTSPAESKNTAMESAAPKGWTGKTHTVQAGDTLTRIATLHQTTVEAIEKENDLTTLSMIRVGQVLKIPAAASAKKESVAAKPATNPASAAVKQAFIATKTESAPAKPATVIATATTKPAGITAVAKPVETKAPAQAEPAAADDVYVVVKGDNPYSIAKKFHVSYNELITANEIKDPTKIQIGQKLKIPKK